MAGRRNGPPLSTRYDDDDDDVITGSEQFRNDTSAQNRPLSAING